MKTGKKKLTTSFYKMPSSYVSLFGLKHIHLVSHLASLGFSHKSLAIDDFYFFKVDIPSSLVLILKNYLRFFMDYSCKCLNENNLTLVLVPDKQHLEF